MRSIFQGGSCNSPFKVLRALPAACSAIRWVSVCVLLPAHRLRPSSPPLPLRTATYRRGVSGREPLRRPALPSPVWANRAAPHQRVEALRDFESNTRAAPGRGSSSSNGEAHRRLAGEPLSASIFFLYSRRGGGGALRLVGFNNLSASAAPPPLFEELREVLQVVVDAVLSGALRAALSFDRSSEP